jgi:hypothetical protein
MPRNQHPLPAGLVLVLAWAQQYPMGLVFMVVYGLP